MSKFICLRLSVYHRCRSVCLPQRLSRVKKPFPSSHARRGDGKGDGTFAVNSRRWFPSRPGEQIKGKNQLYTTRSLAGGRASGTAGDRVASGRCLLPLASECVRKLCVFTGELTRGESLKSLFVKASASLHAALHP